MREALIASAFLGFAAVMGGSLDVAGKNKRSRPRSALDFCYYLVPANIAHVLVAVVWCVLGWMSLTNQSSVTAKWVALGVAIHLGVLVGLAAFRSDKFMWPYQALPHRLPALVILVLFLGAIVPTYAARYRVAGYVCPPGQVACDPPDNHTLVYFSFVTLSTVGYGDYVPVDQTTKTIVMQQIATGWLLLIAAVPLLISRMAIFEEPLQTRNERIRVAQELFAADELKDIRDALEDLRQK